MEAKKLKEIIKLSDIVRRKYNESKKSAIGTEQTLQKTLKPIVAPLETIISQTAAVDQKPKRKKIKLESVKNIEKKFEKKEEDVFETPKKRLPKFLQEETQFESTPEPTIEDIVEDALQTEEGMRGVREYLERLGHIAGKYVGLYITGDPNIDKTKTAIRHTGRELMIGNAKVEIDNNDLIIGGKEYEGTEGLYELLFMKIPDEKKITPQDVENYKNILDTTHARRRAYSVDLQLQGSRAYKYKKYILGKAYKDYVTLRPNYVYFDDVNELIERLKLLIMSKDAGHSGHNNEILAILEELREANIIE